MLPSFFKKGKSRQFDFKARYYNEAKEELQQRYDQLASEQRPSYDSDLSSSFKSNLRQSWERNKKSASPQKKSNFRIVIIALFLFLLCYYFLF